MDSIVYLAGYFAELLDPVAVPRSDDLLSSLVQARESDDRLTDDEITSTAILLFAAGFETTTNLLGNGLLALLETPRTTRTTGAQHPEIAANGGRGVTALRQPGAVQPAHRARACRPPGRAPGARGPHRRPPRRGPPRSGVLRLGQTTLDLRRTDNTPLSFGWGIHHCIGAPSGPYGRRDRLQRVTGPFRHARSDERRAALAAQLHPAGPTRAPDKRLASVAFSRWRARTIGTLRFRRDCRSVVWDNPLRGRPPVRDESSRSVHFSTANDRRDRCRTIAIPEFSPIPAFSPIPSMQFNPSIQSDPSMQSNPSMQFNPSIQFHPSIRSSSLEETRSLSGLSQPAYDGDGRDVSQSVVAVNLIDRDN